MMVSDIENEAVHRMSQESSATLFLRAILGDSKNRKWHFAFFILISSILLLFLNDGFAKDDKKHDNALEIEYGYPDQSIFVATTNDKGHPDSPMKLVAAALMKRAGLSWHAMPYPAKRLFDNLKNGTTNFSILVRAASLAECCIFSEKPVYSTTLNVYSIGDEPAIASRMDLIGKHIITIRGYSYAGLRKFISDPVNKITNEIAGTHKAAFEMLKDQRADYLLDYASAAHDILSKNPIKGIQSTPINQLDIFLVLSKSYPDAENLMIKLEKIASTLDINAILKGNIN